MRAPPHGIALDPPSSGSERSSPGRRFGRPLPERPSRPPRPAANLAAVKPLRVWLVLLSALLLPVRGVLAAAMLCPPAGVGTQAELRLEDHRAAGHAHGAEADAATHDHAHHHADGATQGHDASPTGQDRCNQCSAFCSVTPLVDTTPPSCGPPAAAAARFPALTVPAPHFVAGGPERPPRSR